MPAPASLSTLQSGLSSKTATFNNVYQYTSNPDLIADTKHQQEDLMPNTYSGTYMRSDDVFYPSSLWNQNELTLQSVTAGACFQQLDSNDRTPIIEKVPQSSPSSPSSSLSSSSSSLFFESNCVRPLSNREFPLTTSSVQQRDKMDGSLVGVSAYGTSTDAKTTRIWQKSMQIVPPVTALKWVLNRNSPDEGYQEGCGTDV